MLEKTKDKLIELEEKYGEEITVAKQGDGIRANYSVGKPYHYEYFEVTPYEDLSEIESFCDALETDYPVEYVRYARFYAPKGESAEFETVLFSSAVVNAGFIKTGSEGEIDKIEEMFKDRLPYFFDEVVDLGGGWYYYSSYRMRLII